MTSRGNFEEMECISWEQFSAFEWAVSVWTLQTLAPSGKGTMTSSTRQQYESYFWADQFYRKKLD